MENKLVSSLFVNALNANYAVIPITTGILHRIKRAPSYRCKRDRERERERDVRRQLSADARAFHFSGSSSSADGEDAEGDSLPYHRKSLGGRLYPRVHALQPAKVCCLWLQNARKCSDLANVFTFLLPLNLDHVMLYLGDRTIVISQMNDLNWLTTRT